jgi:twitching motility protein PilI
VECGGSGLLFPLHQAGEIFSVGSVLPVPHTQPWFAGVANLRGGLHAVVDLAKFLGLPRGASPSAGDGARLLALNPTLGVNCALLVDRLAGLRNADQLTPEPAAGPGPAERPAFAGARWCDAEGRVWQEIELAALAGHDRPRYPDRFGQPRPRLSGCRHQPHPVPARDGLFARRTG